MSLSKQARNSLFFALAGLALGTAITYRFAADGNSLLVDQPSIILGHEMPSVEECTRAMLNTFSEKPKVVSAMTEVTDSCYDKIRYQGLLNDFQIRRTKFAIQYSSEIVILWMVVLLTFSGVVLSGLQLFATYKLAKSGQASGMDSNHELTVEQGKLVFRSSVSGLFILVCSFAFFYTYIFNVFTIKELPTTAAPGANPVYGPSDSSASQVVGTFQRAEGGQDSSSGKSFNPFELGKLAQSSRSAALANAKDKRSQSDEKEMAETGVSAPTK